MILLNILWKLSKTSGTYNRY